MQLELFTDTHEHVYTRTQGPHIVSPPISVGTDLNSSRWCWTCASWVNAVGISQWEFWQLPREEIATRYAEKVIAGELHRSDAAHLFATAGFDFFSALQEIKMAILWINSKNGEM